MHRPGRARRAQALVTDRGVDGKRRFGQRSRFLQHHRHISNAFPSTSALDPRCHTGLGAELIRRTFWHPLALWTHTPEWPGTVDAGRRLLDGQRRGRQWRVCRRACLRPVAVVPGRTLLHAELGIQYLAIAELALLSFIRSPVSLSGSIAMALAHTGTSCSSLPKAPRLPSLAFVKSLCF
jgi:hypothetical protein